MRVVRQDALGDAARRRLAEGKRRDAVVLVVQGNLAVTYEQVGQCEKALQMKRDVYFGHLKLNGEEHGSTLISASNYAWGLVKLERFEEAKAMFRKVLPVARHVLGDSNHLTLRMRWNYAAALVNNAGATLGDLREAVTTLEDAGRIARRVFGGAHPLTVDIELALRNA